MKAAQLLIAAILLAFVNTAHAQLAGEYVDDKFLNGHATIHVSVSRKGNVVSISFHGSHNDTPDVGVRFTATGKIVVGAEDPVHFEFEDTCKNSGDGVIASGKTPSMLVSERRISAISIASFFTKGAWC